MPAAVDRLAGASAVSVRQYLRQARTLPRRTVLRRAMQIVRREAAARARQIVDRFVPTLVASTALHEPLLRFFPPPPREILRRRADEIRARSALCLAHRFDLLGSGWIEVRHDMACPGLEGHRYAQTAPYGRDPARHLNRANRRAARRIRALIDPAYRPIDWHIDFKSGYRWPACAWYRGIRHGRLPGVDVKVPWELSRMQHLPVLAWAFALAGAGTRGFLPPAAYAQEFCSQVLDFIASNPPRFGVAWAGTMDTAIRVANWLVARDLLLAAGAAFDPAFEARFAASILEHTWHIVANLEWGVEQRGNHYLADICGLLFAASYLPRSPHADAWLAFAVRELVTEAGLQFHPDGSSFEASTGYHRLSGEMLLWATSLVLALPADKQAALAAYDHRLQPHPPGLAPAPVPSHPIPGSERSSPFPPWFWVRLERSADFTLHLAAPDGRVPPIGDFDSGRFLKLWPAYNAEPAECVRQRWANLEGGDDPPPGDPYWQEDHLDHRHLVAAAAGLFARPDFALSDGTADLETFLVRHLAGVVLPASSAEAETRLDDAGNPQLQEPTARTGTGGSPVTGSAGRWLDNGAGVSGAVSLEIPLPGGDLRSGLQLRAWAGFGLYLFRSGRLYLLVRCGPVGQRGWGGHAHHDQLGLVLIADGKTILADPGSYLYTPLPSRRDEYRSVHAHCAPRTADGREPGRFTLGLFCLPDETRAECLYFGPEGFLGEHRGFGSPLRRRVEILADRVRVTDWGEGLQLFAPALPPPGHISVIPFSPGYGWRERR